MENQPDNAQAAQWNVLPAIAAWLIPGLGHAVLGDRQRGAILAACIGLMWLLGLLIGGISVCDYNENPWWFVGQMLLAPSVAVDQLHDHLSSPDEPRPANRPAFEPSYGRPNEQGTLYTALAGLLNLLAVVDVLYRTQANPAHNRRSGDRPRRPPNRP